jgi:hypothetical protein
MPQWQQLVHAGKPTLKDLLLSDLGRDELRIPPRGKQRRRAVRSAA